MKYDVAERIIYPEETEWNQEAVACVHCERAVPADNAAMQIRRIKWHDWDDPDEDAQGQYKYRNFQEWYCCGFADGFGTLDCARAVIGRGIDAKPEALLHLARSRELRADVKQQALDLLNQQVAYNRDVARLLAEIDHYGRYDDHSPGQIGGGW